MLNCVTLMGRLTADPEVRTTTTGKSVCTFSIAVDRSFARAGEQRQTDFINIVAFGKSAEFAEKYFKKGMKVLVTGRIQTGSYTNKDGQKIYTTDIVAEDQEFCESKSSSESVEEAPKTNTSKSSSKSKKTQAVDPDEDFMTISPEEAEELPW